ncbi:MAG TPA: squalene/phytoene synthase family protein [Solirubrobacteraceae bacterium]
MSALAAVADAYAHCEAITRSQAANFYYGIRLLPRDRRRAMCAAYAFARRVDDIGDGTLEPHEKLRLLDAQERALAALSSAGTDAGSERPADGGEDPVMVALADAQRRFPMPADALAELIEGVRMDVLGMSYESFEDLVPYCRRVAGAIGRVCLAFFNMRESATTDLAHAEQLADDLGVALQLTNILRDVREDAQNGRVYLPSEDLRRFGVIAQGSQGGEPLATMASETLDALTRSSTDAQQLDQLCALVRFEADRAAQWFDLGLELTDLLDRRSAACVLAMAGIYRRLLERIQAHPEQSLTQRMSLPAHEKAWVAARGMLGVGG